ncbi:MAG: hypothetical protein LBO81_04175 [Clostridiales Family XIII bacterium]|nr:hypothetical protein [Clostridiales Family XIII bacterium]
MKHAKTPVAFALCLALAASLLIGCNRSDPPTETEAAQETETYDFSVFFGNAEDPVKISELISRYETEKGIVVKPIITEAGDDNERALWRALESSNPPAAYLISANTNEGNIVEGGFMAELSSILPSVSGRSIPGIFRGSGWAADKRLISDLVGEDRAEAFLADMRSADYEDWVGFVDKLNAYILRGTAASFRLNGREYGFPEEKGPYAAQLNGVFAVAGGDADFRVNELLSLALSTSDPTVWAAARRSAAQSAETEAENAGTDADGESTTAGAFDAVRPGLSVYIEGLDLITSHMAGRYAPGVRGEGFIDDALYGKKEVRDIFAKGKAAFAATDSGDLDEIAALNAAMAANLVLLPIKLPYAENGLPGVREGRVVNSSIPVRVTHSFCVNARFAPDVQRKALDFILWLLDATRSLDGSLENSVRAYFDAGDVLPYASEEENLKSYAETLHKEGMDVYLTTNRWDAAHKESLLNFMFTLWYEG